MKCDLCEKYQMPVKDFTGKNDVHLVNRWFYPNMITCESCNDIMEKGEKIDIFEIEDKTLN